MSAATQDRATLVRDGKSFVLPVAASTKIFAGTLVAIASATGYAGPMTAATTWKVAGMAAENVDNSNGAAGDKTVRVTRGCFCFNNGESITRASIGATAYANDDNTVYTTSTGRSACGIIRNVDSDGVWVEL